MNLKGHRGMVRGVQICPKTSRIASVDQSGCLRIGELWRSDPTHLIKDAHSVALGVCWLADQQHVVSAGTRDVVCWNAQTGRAAGRLELDSGVVWQLCASPCGRWIAATGQNGGLRIIETQAGQLQLRRDLLDGVEGSFVTSFSPDGARVLFQLASSALVELNVADGELSSALVEGLGYIHTASRSPDGGHAVLAAWDAQAEASYMNYLCDGRTLQTKSQFQWTNSAVRAIAWSSDGGRFAVAAMSNAAQVWDRENLQAPLQFEGLGDFGVGNDLSLSADGETLAMSYAGGKLRLWDLRS